MLQQPNTKYQTSAHGKLQQGFACTQAMRYRSNFQIDHYNLLLTKQILQTSLMATCAIEHRILGLTL